MRVAWPTLAVGILALGLGGCVRKDIPGPQLRESYEPYSSYKYGDARTEWAELDAKVGPAQRSPAERNDLNQLLVGMVGSPGVTPDAVMMACRDLAMTGGDKEVPALAKLLENDATAEAGRYALERIPGQVADKALRHALDSAKGPRQVGVINSIGKRGDRGSVGKLVDLVQDWDPEVASAAATALGHIGGPKAARALSEAPKTSDTAVQRVFTDSYLRVADGYVKDGRPDDAAKIYRKVYGTSSDRPMKMAALRGLVETEPEAATPALAAAMAGEDTRLRGEAAKLLEIAPPGAKTTKILMEAAQKAHVDHAAPEYQAALIEVIGRRGDKEALPLVVTLAGKSGYEPVRIAALGAEGRLGDASVIKPLALAAANGADAEKAAARESLAKLPGADVDQAIAELFETSGTKTRAELIRAMTARKSKGAAAFLIQASADPEEDVALAALEGLGQIATASDLPGLIGAARDHRGEKTRAAAEESITAVVSRVGDKDRAADLIIAGLEASNSAQGRATALELLGRTRGDKARAILVSSLKDPDPVVRLAAAKGLGQWEGATSADELLAAAKAEDLDNVREAELGAYSRLTAINEKLSDSEKAGRMAEAIELAKTPAEKMAVLDHLHEVYSLEGLLLADALTNDPDKDVKKLALATGLQIAFWTSGTHTSEARAFAKKALTKTKDENLVRDANLVLETVAKFAGHITAWQVAGPYKKQRTKGSDLFNEVFPPEDPAAAEGEKWSAMPLSTDPARPWALDLGKAIGGDNRAAYLRTMIYSPVAQDARLELGSDDGVKAWFNGQVVHENNTVRPLKPGEDVVNIQLLQGWNTVMLKVVNGSGQWETAASIRDLNGGEIPDLKAAVPGATGTGGK